jgi:hypothetical protein
MSPSWSTLHPPELLHQPVISHLPHRSYHGDTATRTTDDSHWTIVPLHFVGDHMAQLEFSMDIGRNKIGVVRRTTRPCSHKCSARQNQTQGLPQMWKMRPTRHTTTPTDTRWECGRDLTLDKVEGGVHHANGPPQHPPGLVDSPLFSLLAPH